MHLMYVTTPPFSHLNPVREYRITLLLQRKALECASREQSANTLLKQIAFLLRKLKRSARALQIKPRYLVVLFKKVRILAEK